MIAKVVKKSQRDWDQHIPNIMAAYRSFIHSATDYSPNFLIFDQECRAPIDLVLRNPDPMTEDDLSVNEFMSRKQLVMMKAYETVRNSLKVCAQTRKKTYDFKVRQTEFFLGQEVWYYYPRKYAKRSQKFQFVQVGPYTGERKVGTVNYLIRKNKKSECLLVHVDRLKLCKNTSNLECGRAM